MTKTWEVQINGCVKGYFDSGIYFCMHGACGVGTDAGGEVRRPGGYQRSRRDLLGQEQRTLHGRPSGEDHQGSGCAFHDTCDGTESECILTVREGDTLVEQQGCLFVSADSAQGRVRL